MDCIHEYKHKGKNKEDSPTVSTGMMDAGGGRKGAVSGSREPGSFASGAWNGQ